MDNTAETTLPDDRKNNSDETGANPNDPNLEANALSLARRVRALGIFLGDVQVTGISLGLPNGASKRPVFTDDAVELLLRGDNLIEELPASVARAQLDRNIVQIVKSATGERQRRPLSAVHEVIQLASRIGHFDLAAEFGVDPRVVETLDTTYALAVGAGLKALHNAGLVAAPTASKHEVAAHRGELHDWKLSPSQRDETGVIFAASFPALDSLVDELSRFMEGRLAEAGKAGRARFAAELEAAATRVPEAARAAMEGLAAHMRDETAVDDGSGGGGGNGGSGSSFQAKSTFEFNRKLLFKLLVMANSQLAELVQARGPNLHVNAACAGTTAAISLGCDWIRAGRCKRVVVIAADNPSSENLMPWIGTGFLALGAASVRSSVAEAACPFDRRRNGLVLGAGAVGLVLEADSTVEERTALPLARVLAAQHANSCYHASAIGTNHAVELLDSLLCRVEQLHGIHRADLAHQLLYVSHETFTHARGGGCAGTEVKALRACFGAAARTIVIANSKGMTGHAMGVCFEDALAVAALSTGVAPPIANYLEPDPALAPLKLSSGGEHGCKYALHFAAGFGSQVCYVLYAKS